MNYDYDMDMNSYEALQELLHPELDYMNYPQEAQLTTYEADSYMEQEEEEELLPASTH